VFRDPEEGFWRRVDALDLADLQAELLAQLGFEDLLVQMPEGDQG